MTVTIEVPMTLPSLNVLLGMHWAARAKKVRAQRDAMRLVLQSKAVGTYLDISQGRLVVSFTRVGARLLDSDNVVGACKHVRDAVSDYFGLDDGDVARIRFEYAQAKGKPSCVRASFAVEDVRALSSVQP